MGEGEGKGTGLPGEILWFLASVTWWIMMPFTEMGRNREE